VVPVFHVVTIRPRTLIGEEGEHEAYGLAVSASIGKREAEQVVIRGTENLANDRHNIEVEDAIAIWLRAAEFLGEAAVAGDLVGDKDGLKPLPADLSYLTISGKARELRCLRYPRSSVIVPGVALLLAVRRCGHPSQ